jgi:uncharacterized damage-inducible protein DinB
MPDEYDTTDEFRGASFQRADLTGTTFRDCDFTGARIIGSLIGDLTIDGYWGEGGGVVVNGVDVTAFVQAELDRRNPEREPAREARTAEEIRDTWTLLEELWADTLAHAEQLPEAARHERVDEEWSLVETLRHLVFAVDVWVGRMILGDDEPAFHPLGLPATDFAPETVAGLGLDADASPTYADALAALGERRVQMRAVVDVVTDEELDEVRTAVRVPAWGEETHTVRAVLRVMLDEFCAHRIFAERDLARLTTS